MENFSCTAPKPEFRFASRFHPSLRSSCAHCQVRIQTFSSGVAMATPKRCASPSSPIKRQTSKGRKSRLQVGGEGMVCQATGARGQRTEGWCSPALKVRGTRMPERIGCCAIHHEPTLGCPRTWVAESNLRARPLRTLLRLWEGCHALRLATHTTLATGRCSSPGRQSIRPR
jgi:hypothetical protein